MLMWDGCLFGSCAAAVGLIGTDQVQTVTDGLGPVAEIREKHDAVKVFSVILLRIR
jgi:hypothetical protein